MRALFDDNGKRVDEAGPSSPIQVCDSVIFSFFMLSVTVDILKSSDSLKHDLSYTEES